MSKRRTEKRDGYRAVRQLVRRAAKNSQKIEITFIGGYSVEGIPKGRIRGIPIWKELSSNSGVELELPVSFSNIPCSFGFDSIRVGRYTPIIIRARVLNN